MQHNKNYKHLRHINANGEIIDIDVNGFIIGFTKNGSAWIGNLTEVANSAFFSEAKDCSTVAVKCFVSETFNDKDIYHFKYKFPQTICNYFLSNGSFQITVFPKEQLIRLPKNITRVSKKKKILCVDDSATMRKLLKSCIQKNNSYEVIGELENAKNLKESILNLCPDFLTVDINMPFLSGVEALRLLYKDLFVPALMVTSLNPNEAPEVLEALEIGAVDYLEKPNAENMNHFLKQLNEKLTAVSQFNPKVKTHYAVTKKTHPTKNFKAILIGASTGGTEAIKDILAELPKLHVPILIVQHIPEMFSKAFANRLNTICKFPVKEAIDGEIMDLEHAYVAQGSRQMSIIKNKKNQYEICISNGPEVSGHKPSVDHMFSSVAKTDLAADCLVLLLTGMGADGAKGMLELKDKGAFTIGQNEASCIVYGMPKAAKKINASIAEMNQDEIVSYISSCFEQRQKNAI